MPADRRLLVTLCTYNERGNIGRLIPEIHRHAPQADVLVIDDNSPDGTGELADELAAGDQRIHVLHRPGKQGLGTATVAGFRYGIEHDYDLLLNMDADFSHPPETIPALLETASRADVAVGSRYVAGGGVEGWGPHRHVMSWGINTYARLILGLKTKDNSGSFRCYRVDKLAEVDLDRIRARGYAIQEEILYRCRKVGCTFEEVPFVFKDRTVGESKISWKDAVGALWVLLTLRFGK
ncbi:MAG: polyprenol monophosphomannose synthase [Planctomycetota bacterium]|nr:MAG: polyprenol monophosphomannose synthase [Planctomycetota bacterium]REJ95734.1 MAG: polyprenol monophosphomannose synthase [Planctomycetota bacterium]REK23394.1 MAG: polyprenol monophosphomannose synthase [Planctomycetota bacterium]REK38969.1 MAG: polyprenol monophosphomannose synthase [Planctomycetota bacterium]